MPETAKLRRRQARLGIFVFILALFTVGQSVYSYYQDENQRECLTKNFAQLTTSLQLRGKIAEEEAAIRQASDAAQTGLILGVFNAKSREESLQVFKDFTITLEGSDQEEGLNQRQTKVNKQREETEIPDFPKGTCGT